MFKKAHLTIALVMALVLAGIAPASDPAATLDVIREYHADGPLSKTVFGVVAIDDAWGVILFSLLFVVAESLTETDPEWIEVAKGLWDVVGAGLLGFIIGLPMAWITGRLTKGEPTILEASGFVFICGGLALFFNVSYLIACMVLGATVANFAKHHKRPFREIENASQPFLVIFFLLSGYECNLSAFAALGFIGLVYIVTRSLGLVLGGGFAARLAHASPMVQKRVGWCLLPQAGVALGLALLVAERLPELGKPIISIILATTVIFEIGSPLMTRWHFHKAGEI